MASLPVEPFKILAIVVLASAIVEALNWLLVFRRSSFKHIKSEVALLQGKVNALAEAGKPDSDKTIKRLKDSIAKASAQLYSYKMQTMVCGCVWGVPWIIAVS
jgi:hypothetical protein